MKVSEAIETAEMKWRAEVQRSAGARDASPVLAVCGPSGVGKTTVSQAFRTECGVYIESAEENPYLKALLRGKGRFDATESQEWFLDRIAQYIYKASTRRPLVLDQDPAAVVLAYSRMFHDDGLITGEHYAALLQRLLEVEVVLRRWRSPRTVMCLDAPATVLRERVIRRANQHLTPPLEWFERIRSYFLSLYACFPGAVYMSTEAMVSGEVVLHAKRLFYASGQTAG